MQERKPQLLINDLIEYSQRCDLSVIGKRKDDDSV